MVDKFQLIFMALILLYAGWIGWQREQQWRRWQAQHTCVDRSEVHWWWRVSNQTVLDAPEAR